MTVPGKGGRPRKWASQRDRQRAWRARQAGQPEPDTYANKLDDGDLLAAALTERDHLASELAELRQQAAKEHAELRRELDDLRVQHEAAENRHTWLDNRHDILRARHGQLEADHAHLRAEHHELRSQHAALTRPAPAVESGELSMSRAQRRQAERDAKRRNR